MKSSQPGKHTEELVEQVRGDCWGPARKDIPRKACELFTEGALGGCGPSKQDSAPTSLWLHPKGCGLDPEDRPKALQGKGMGPEASNSKITNNCLQEASKHSSFGQPKAIRNPCLSQAPRTKLCSKHLLENKN